jgi:hypothetical protein
LVVADTQLTGGNYALRVQKIVRLPDGSVATGCGAWAKAYAGLKWLEQGMEGQPPDIDGATLAIVSADGSIQIAESQWPPYPILDTEMALGCAQDLIRARMADGDDPFQAVAKACEQDLLSSAPLISMRAAAVADWDGPTVHEVCAKRTPKAKITGERK